ncbi:MAG: helix-turn-helix domain-containing protein [Alphaproteobacteria bacterium]|nr:helix-turn-helix domain-containing protein [Alphaproteobacteria bacterium]
MSIVSPGIGHNGGPPLREPLRELYSPKDVEHILSISHAQLYRLLGEGRLTAVKIGRSSFITRACLEQFIASLPVAKIGEAA